MQTKYNKVLSDNLKKLLFFHNMKATELARAVELPQPTIHRLINGKSKRPYASTIKIIADFFSLSVHELLKTELSLSTAPNMQPRIEAIKQIPLVHYSELQTLKDSLQKTKQSTVSKKNLSLSAFAIMGKIHEESPNSIFIFDPETKARDRQAVIVRLENNELCFGELLIDGEKHYLKQLNVKTKQHSLHNINNTETIIASLIEVRQRCPNTD